LNKGETALSRAVAVVHRLQMENHMKGEITIYRPNQAPTVTQYDRKIPLGELQAAVGGYIETVPYFIDIEHAGGLRKCVVFCNEEGKLHGLPENPGATALWDASLKRQGLDRFDAARNRLDHLVGDIAIATGDAEFMRAL
jgi:hypothetical protein